MSNLDGLVGNFTEVNGLTNTGFTEYIDEFNDKNKSNNLSSKKSTEGASTGNNPIAKYFCGENLPSCDIVNSKNFIPKSSFSTEESQKDEIIEQNKQNAQNKNIQTQIPKEEKEENLEVSYSAENNFSDSVNLVILTKTVGNELYAVYQNLENYQFSLVNFTLKNSKNPVNFVGDVKLKNSAYLNINDYSINYFNFYKNYLKSIGPFGVIQTSTYGYSSGT